MQSRSLLNGRVRVVELEPIVDPRGVLTPLDFDALDFAVRRVFLVRAEPGAVRGGHGHRAERQLFQCLSGRIEVELRLARTRERVSLSGPETALLVEPPVWSRQRYHGESPAMMVYCDRRFDPDDYLWNAE